MVKKFIILGFSLLLTISCQDVVYVMGAPTDAEFEKPQVPEYEETYAEIYADSELQIGDLYLVSSTPKEITVNNTDITIFDITDVTSSKYNILINVEPIKEKENIGSAHSWKRVFPYQLEYIYKKFYQIETTLDSILIRKTHNPEYEIDKKLSSINLQSALYVTGISYDNASYEFNPIQWIADPAVLDFAKSNSFEAFIEQYGNYYAHTIYTGFDCFLIEKVTVNKNCEYTEDYVISEIETIKGIKKNEIYSIDELEAKVEALKVPGIKREFFFFTTFKETPELPVKSFDALQSYFSQIKNKTGNLPITITRAKLMEIDSIYSQLTSSD